ncbi:MAG: DUF1636 domain-containing protein [Oscillatoria sp. SIO1A7]|nr:DUF1636 domain-containing protein [Oscillatoria sp. SIO1A7]
MTQNIIYVCTTCASTWQNGKRVGISGGEKLLEQLSNLHDEWELKEKFPIQPVECMSACNRSCTISFVAPGKHTYLFGDISTESETLSETCEAVLDCASLYYRKTDGVMPWSERPKALKKGILAKIPPLPSI